VKSVQYKMEELEPEMKVKLPKPNKNLKLPALNYGQNPEVPSLSSAVSVNYNSEFGRHLTANRIITTGIKIVETCIYVNYKSSFFGILNLFLCDFNSKIFLIVVGDILIVEESVVSSIYYYDDVQWEYCNFCFKHCLSLIPCTVCGHVRVNFIRIFSSKYIRVIMLNHRGLQSHELK